MMTHDLGGIGSGNVLFACGHENPAGNRYCNACGAARDRRCPLCNSLNQGYAKFCGGCGARLLDEATLPETTVANPALRRSQDHGTPVTPRTTEPAEEERAILLGSDNPFPDREKPPWIGKRQWRRNTTLSSPIPDMTEEDEWEPRDGRRKAYLAAAAVTVAIVIAIVLGSDYFSPARYGGAPERTVDRPAVEGSPSATRGAEPPAQERTDPSAASSMRESETTTPDVARNESAPDASEAPARPSAAELPATSPSLPSRSPSDLRAMPGDGARGDGAPRPLVSAPETSEERIANFLIEQLGAAPAAEKALSTAAWYDAGGPENAYWHRVAEAIRSRGGL